MTAGWFGPHLAARAGSGRIRLLEERVQPLERELEDLVLNCSKCGLDTHWVSGLGVTPGHWAHREPAPHHEPTPGLL